MTPQRDRRMTLLLTIVATMLLTTLPARGWAQAPADPTRPAGAGRPEDMVVLILLVAVAFLPVLGVVGKVLELRLKRDGEAVAVRGVVSERSRRIRGSSGSRSRSYVCACRSGTDHP